MDTVDQEAYAQTMSNTVPEQYQVYMSKKEIAQDGSELESRIVVHVKVADLYSSLLGYTRLGYVTELDRMYQEAAEPVVEGATESKCCFC